MDYQCRSCQSYVGFHAIYKKMICRKCYYEFLNDKMNEEEIEIYIEKRLEEKGMVYIEMDNHKYISEVDYLKVLEEKESIEKNLHRVQDHLKIKVIECKEKDEIIKRYENLVTLDEEKLLKELKEKGEEIKVITGQREELISQALEKNEKINHYKNKWNNAVMMGDKIINEKDEEINKFRISLNNSIKETCERNKELLKQDKKIEDLEKQNEYYAKEYERLKERIEKADSRVESYEEWYNNNVYEFNKMKEENERLKNLYEPEIQYEEWVYLTYYFKVQGNKTKHYQQEMLQEDAYELIGMDSDNWTSFNVVKFKKEVK